MHAYPCAAAPAGAPDSAITPTYGSAARVRGHRDHLGLQLHRADSPLPLWPTADELLGSERGHAVFEPMYAGCPRTQCA
jgi:hypothetical protein